MTVFVVVTHCVVLRWELYIFRHVYIFVDCLLKSLCPSMSVHMVELARPHYVKTCMHLCTS